MLPSLNKRKHSVYIQLTGFMSAVSFAIVATSFGTQGWINATANPNIEGLSTSNVTYGLFRGTFIRRLLESPNEYELFFTCIWAENSCAWSCNGNAESREFEVQLLLDGETPNFSCSNRPSKNNFVQVEVLSSRGSHNERIFTNAGLWLSTIIFLIILLVALAISVVLSVLNCTKSPIETFFNIQGIYVANGTALVANFLTLILYGICYDMDIKEDISIYDTIVGNYSSDASLGYSYWILIPPCIFHAAGIFFLALRETKVNSDRSETKMDVATDTPATGVLF